MSGLSLSTNLRLMQNNIVNMIMFDKLKTGNNFIDGILTTIVLTIITYMFQFINDKLIDNSKHIFELFINVYNIFINNTECSIEFECLTSTSVNIYNSGINHTGIFSDKTKALLEHIMLNNTNNTITKIKECKANESIYRPDCDRSTRGRNLSMFIVCQESKFLVDNKRKIYAKTTFNNEEVNSSNDKNKSSTNIEKITIKLFSYKSNIASIREFVDEITLKYLMNLESNRSNKKFIYTLVSPPKIEDENDINNCWDEVIFSSTRQFSNIFFDEKDKLLKKVKFFIENKEWYSELGIPYSLGIGLHGPPGTGKTSIIKAIANYTNRHIIIISLKLIKTKQQLEKIFFENRYNTNNCKHSITFNNKIIVFEDIDCIGDIVLKRENKT